MLPRLQLHCSKARIFPAFCTLGPRLSLPHQVGAYVGGGGLQHVRHLINVDGSLVGRLLIPIFGVLPNWESTICQSGRVTPLLLWPYNAVLL